MSDINAVIKRIEKLATLPDAWIFAGTELCVGDARQLVAEINTLRAAFDMKKRDELLSVAAQLGIDDDGALAAVQWARVLIDEVDKQFTREHA